MVAYSFRKQFVKPIIEGTKRQTIRAERRSRHVRAGEQLQLYTAMRTKYCRLIGRATCLRSSPIELDFLGEQVRIRELRGVFTIWPLGLDQFARDDGFADWAALQAFWAAEHPELTSFAGVIIRWTEFVAAV
jgi:uncharacterized protein YqfB (UPF0267 family)